MRNHGHVSSAGAKSQECDLLLTQRDLLHQVQVAGEELGPERVVQVEGHAVATHGVICGLPAIPERLVSGSVLKVGRRAAAVFLKRDLHGG